MDWPFHRKPFLDPEGTNKADFRYGESAVGDMKCEVLQFYQPEPNEPNESDKPTEPNESDQPTESDRPNDGKVAQITLNRAFDWLYWIQDAPIFHPEARELRCPIDKLPNNGLCILFIPRVKDIVKDVQADFTDLPLPLNQQLWDQIAKSFYLHSHITKTIKRKETSIISISHVEEKQKLWMHTAMIPPQWKDNFALASTHFRDKHFTFAVMFGCSADQIKKVKDLLEGREDAIGKQLLMLGICAELHLDRLRDLVFKCSAECYNSKDDLERRNQQTLDWDLIKKVGIDRAKTKKAEEEIKATKRQLYKALPPAIRMRLNRDETDDEVGHNLGASVELLNDETELTDMFLERFADIFAQFEGLIATCRVSVEELSFTADAVTNELARQSTASGSELAKASTVIAFVAMLYLPLTAVATIFTMPVFQFANDWRNWRYQPVRAANSSTPDSGTSLPVFSGYFWIYLGISAALMLFTVEAWWRFGRGEVKRRRDKYWTTHLIATILIYLIRLAILILFILIYFLLRVRRQHAKSLKDWTIRMARKIHSYLGMSVNFIRFVVAAGAKAIFDPIITSLQGCLQPSTQPNTETVPESDPQRPQQDLVGRPPSPPPRQSPPASPGTSSPQSQKQNDVTRSGDDMV